MTEYPPMEISEVIATLNDGATMDELKDTLVEIVKAVRATGKKGKLVYTIEVAMAAKNAENTLAISDKIKAEVPEFDRAKTVFFTNQKGDLARSPFEQLKLPYELTPVNQTKENDNAE